MFEGMSKRRLAVLLVLVAVFLTLLFFLLSVPRKLDPQGEAVFGCHVDEFSPIPNGQGLVVTGHATGCDNFIHDSAVYLYLHGENERPGSEALIFRYADEGIEVPVVTWINDSELSISIGKVVLISKIIDHARGVKIDYTIGKELYPGESWNEEIRKTKRFGAILFGLLIIIGYVIWKLCKPTLQRVDGKG